MRYVISEFNSEIVGSLAVCALMLFLCSILCLTCSGSSLQCVRLVVVECQRTSVSVVNCVQFAFL